ncbi:transporter [bacterium DOLZORAL124_64_63]|nr:MAG: transporter [bacterium DOLZORAL124_64_63]
MRSKRRLFPFLLGIALFLGFYLSPALPDAVDPAGRTAVLTHEGKAAIGLFMLAGVWWIFEVLPAGVTGLGIAVAQSLWLIRAPRQAMTDFMDPSVFFIFGSLLIGAAFSATGLTKRMAFYLLKGIPERTPVIYLGVFSMTAFMTLFMAHTAVVSAIFPLVLIVYQLYEPTGRPTRFGKGLFIGMAYAAGAGSIITLLGAARGAVAIGFYRQLTGRDISFFELTKYMAPLGVVMVLLLWVYICLVFRPERGELPGLRAKAEQLYAKLGPITRREIATLVIVLGLMALLTARSFVPALKPFDKSAIILGAGILFFVLGILRAPDLEAVPWNIILLFGGAMSIGFCLWQTGAAQWMALGWLGQLENAPWLLFLVGVAALILIMTNFIMNVAAIAITLPVSLVMAPFIGVAPEIVTFVALATAGMPFMLLVGAAPNAIAYESGQFRTREFFLAGIPASGMLLAVLTLFIWKIWPWMGMPVVLG